MATVNIENFPDELYAKLSVLARERGRVINEEIIEAARHLVGTADSVMNVSEKLAMADRVRKSTPGAYIDDDQIQRARYEGRL